MKKLANIMSIAIMAFLIFGLITNVFASDLGITITQPSDKGIQTVGGKIIGIIQVIGNVLAVGVLVVLGIKYMLGSAEEKAEYKKTMMPYLIGAVLIFAGANLANILYKAIGGIATTTP